MLKNHKLIIQKKKKKCNTKNNLKIFNLIPVTIVITKKYIIICLKLNEGGPDSSVTIFFSNVMNNSRENKALSPTIKNES